MYKLNILAPKEFFEMQTPINFLQKKRNFANIKEIKKTIKDEYGQIVRFQSLPHTFWFRNFEKPAGHATMRHQRSFSPTKNLHYGLKNPIFIKRQDMKKKLQQFKSRACTPSPSKKQKKCHYIYCQNKSMKIENKSPQKQKTYTNLDDSNRNGSIFSQQNSIEIAMRVQLKNLQHKKLPVLQRQKAKQLDRMESDIMNTSIHKIGQPECSPIIEKSQPTKQLIIPQVRNKFLNDTYRLYGLNTEIKQPKNKLQMEIQKICKSTESKEMRKRDLEFSLQEENQLPKPSLSQNKLFNLLKKNRYLQQEKSQKKILKSQSPNQKLQNQKKSKCLITSYFSNDKEITSHFFRI